MESIKKFLVELEDFLSVRPEPTILITDTDLEMEDGYKMVLKRFFDLKKNYKYLFL